MRRIRDLNRRIVAIDPISRGYGYVVLQGPERLLDWGVKSVRRNKEERTLLAVSRLLELYVPDALVVEDVHDPRSRRVDRVRRLLRNLEAVAASAGIRTEAIAVHHVKQVFADGVRATKHVIAGAVATRFPELARHRPKFRKPWMSEDERMAIFDAAGFGIAYYAHR